MVLPVPWGTVRFVVAAFFALVSLGVTARAAVGNGDRHVTAVSADANAADMTLTDSGVGGYRLGRTLASLRASRLIGAVRKGCDISSPPDYWAHLRAPLRGTATFRGNSPGARLVFLYLQSGVVTGGGIRVGSSGAAVRRAYPQAHKEKSEPPDPLQVDAFTVVRAGKIRMWFSMDRGRVKSISIPGPEFCE
jgi:hypothetical protein